MSQFSLVTCFFERTRENISHIFRVLTGGQIMPATLLPAPPLQIFRPSYGPGSQCIFLPSDYNLLLLFYVSYEKQDTFPCALRSFPLWSFGASCKKWILDNKETFFLFINSIAANQSISTNVHISYQ